MKELDFDELDRAVSSLMKNADAGTPPHTPEEKVVTIPSTLGDQRATPDLPTPSPTPSAQPPVNQTAPAHSERSSLTNPTARVSPAARRGGRFMDVVPPSSAMASASSRPVSREGVTITAPTTAPAATAAVSPASPAAPVSEPEAPVPSWPDPIDFHKDAPTTPATESPSVGSETPTSLSSVEQADESDMLQSPFLSGAKVDKRPLGAFVKTDKVTDSTSTSDSLPETEAVQPTTEPDVQLPEVPAPTIVPDELKSDIIAIESDDSAIEVEKTEVTATVQSDAQPVTAVSLGTTSIKQQYQETPSSTPVEHAPIYDSEPYHQSLAHPAKKKTGWLIVFLILLLLALGAGAGAAIYFFVL